MKLYLVCDSEGRYTGLYDDFDKAQATIHNDAYYYEFDLDNIQYYDDGAIMDTGF